MGGGWRGEREFGGVGDGVGIKPRCGRIFMKAAMRVGWWVVLGKIVCGLKGWGGVW